MYCKPELYLTWWGINECRQEREHLDSLSAFLDSLLETVVGVLVDFAAAVVVAKLRVVVASLAF